MAYRVKTKNLRDYTENSKERFEKTAQVCYNTTIDYVRRAGAHRNAAGFAQKRLGGHTAHHIGDQDSGLHRHFLRLDHPFLCVQIRKRTARRKAGTRCASGVSHSACKQPF